jgi:GT2 family glycosyltransferase
MKLYLVTVNFNGFFNTEKLIESLDEQTNKEFGLIVVDNASQPDDLKKLRQITRPWLTLIENLSNDGFAAGTNIGIRSALAEGAEWIIIINNDAWVKEHFITQVKAFVSCRAGMLIALPIRESEKTAYVGKIRWLAPTLPHIHYPITSEQLRKERGYVIGAGIIVHKSVFEKIGFLDERYFLYFEDADFSERARKAGITTDIAPAVINHVVSASTQKLGAPVLLRYHYRNMLLFNRLHAPGYIQAILPIWAFFGIIKQILKLVVRPSERPQSKAIFAGILDHLTSRYGRIGH